MPKRSFSERGSAPLEIAALMAILLIPISPMLNLFETALDHIAAESIARHSLRYALLQAEPAAMSELVELSVARLAEGWGRVADFSFSCGSCQRGSMAQLTVSIGNASATQTAGIPPK